MAQIVMIDRQKLKPHPDNPRRELGDLAELADSIRASGILQNLTVVPDPDSDGCYRIVIGHRRFAAGKEAGLTQFPCVIADMSPNDQLATMMAENIQRHDLTLYEQIQGVGRMVQLGMDLPDIARKTGISEKTVRRDAKICGAFRRDSLKKAVGQNVTVEELIALQEIEDEQTRNAVLEKYGQGYPFNQAKVNAISAQNSAKFRAGFMEKIKGLPIHQLKKPNERWSGLWDTVVSVSGLDALGKMKPLDLKDGVEYAWYCEGQVAGVLKKDRTWERDKAEAKRRDKAIRDMSAEAERLNAECEDLRDAFIATLPAGTKEETARAEHLMAEAILSRKESSLRWQTKIDVDDLLLVLLGDEGHDLTFDEKGNVLNALRGRRIPDRRIAAALALNVDPWDRKLIRVERGRFVIVPTSDYAMTYGILLELGYRITDLEQSLMDGTHEIFREEVSA